MIRSMMTPSSPTDRDRISATDAADRLGVKRETIYAYVSRGLLTSRRALDGKTSTFDPNEVDALRTRRRRGPAGELTIAIGTSITLVEDGQLWYRGHDALALAGGDTDYEAVASLLWTGALGGPEEWRADDRHRAVADTVGHNLPSSTGLLDRLRVATIVVSSTDELRNDLRPESVIAAARATLATMVDTVPLHGPEGQGRLADRLWPRLTARPGAARDIAALNGALVLLADHDLATSTLAARVAASARADPYSVIQTGLGTFGGTLHGAAGRGVHDLLERAMRAPTAAAAIGDAWRRERFLPGLGHGLYPGGDPRALVLFDLIERADPDPNRYQLVSDLLDLARERTGLEPNVDFALAAMAFSYDMVPEAAEALFTIGRTAGWIAHALEEYGEAELRFRPRGRYHGPRPATLP